MNFDELLKEELENLDGVDDYLEGFWLASATDDELEEYREELGLDEEDFQEYLDEALKKRVSARGAVKKVKSRKIRRQRATRTTGMSKAKLKQRARRSARTRKRNPAAMKKSIRKRKKALKRRKNMGLK